MARKETIPQDQAEEVPEGRRIPLGVRTTASTRARLDLAALKSGRSLAQEVEFRLEQSLHDEDMLKQMRSQMEFIERVVGAIGEGETGDLLMKLARGIADVETAQGVKWCHPNSNLDAYDITLKDVMEGIRRVWFKRSEATMADFMALEHPLLMKDPPKMKD